jgi:methylated-DNA-[protein]-cysteine S-methyltransferase
MVVARYGRTESAQHGSAVFQAASVTLLTCASADAPKLMQYTTVETPLGELMLWGDQRRLAGADFVEPHNSSRLPEARRALRRGRLTPGADWQYDPHAFTDVVEQLRAYFEGRLTHFEVAVDTGGTPFQQRVWGALQRIPFGTTTTYGGLAEALGEPKAVRAVGLANGANPISIIIPCHRVVGANGSLTGYGGGLARKEWLLAHERGEVRLPW